MSSIPTPESPEGVPPLSEHLDATAPEALALSAALAPPGEELAALAAEVGAPAAAAFLADPGRRAEVAALRTFLGAVRTGLAGASAGEPAGGASATASARRLTRRVLARTTRLDRGWRGDLRLVADFAAERLRASALLRVAAALLLVQLTVVPIVAWHLWRAPRPEGFQVRIERRAAEQIPDGDVADRLEPIAVLEDATLPALASEQHSPALRALGRAVLEAHAVLSGAGADQPQLAAGGAAGPGEIPGAGIERLLRERAQALAGVQPEGWVPSGPVTPLERLIALDLALDRRLVLGHARELGALLDGSAAQLAAAAPDSYAGALLRRTAALHLAPAGAGSEAGARVEFVGAGGGAVPDATDVPALRRALTAAGAADGPWARAWLAALAQR